MTKIMFCGCTHAFQDQRYGSHQRVHNSTGNAKKPAVGYRCTACGTDKLKQQK